MSLLLAALTVWLPTVAPLLFGPLNDCTRCLQTYVAMMLIVPGVLLPVLLQADGLAFVVLAALPTAALFHGVYVAARSLSCRWLHVVQVLVLALAAFEAIGFAYALRM